MSMVFSDIPIPQELRKYYFEVRINDQGQNASIGIGLTKMNQQCKNGRMPGWDEGSLGYHADDGGIYHNQEGKQETCETYTSQDVVGCMMTRMNIDDMPYIIVYFTKNGRKLQPVRCLQEGDYYPAIGMGSVGAKVTANLDEHNFLYNDNGINEL